LRLVDTDAVSGKETAKDVVVRSRTTTGQVLWPATEEDIEILSQSKLMYPTPMEVEGSVIIRLVRLSDPVTSPVGRTVRNRQFGIRGNEKWQLLAMGAVCTILVYCLGVWQLYRMEWKRELLEMRRERLAAPRLVVNSSPFPWKDQVEDYVYRIVDVRGVFDHRREMRVGPRPGMDEETGNTQPGYNIVTPLRLEDGSTVLVNRGHVGMDKLDHSDRPEAPTWVRIRGVLEQGEIANFVASHARLKNRPDRNQFVYVVADELAENAGARNHQECAQALITAFDCLYEDDFKAGMRRQVPFSMKHKEDYLLFWADEHTHFNYAMQWFGLGTLLMTMTVYKFIEVSRWRY
jgi:cytochrome oxidase assembly protein ShyY1